MESQNIEFRAVIKFLTKEGAKAREIHRRMADVYGDSSPKYSTVAKRSAEFNRERDSLEDDPRPGRPADVISQEMVDRAERLVLINRRIKAAELTSECGISNGLHYNPWPFSHVKSIYQLGTQKPEHARSSAKGGVKSRASGSVQCQSRRLSHSSCNFLKGNGHGVLGLQRDYIDRLQACWYFNYRRILCQYH